MNKLKPWIPIFFLFIGVKSFAQQSFTLETAKQYALENNFKVKNSELDLQNADLIVKETRGIGLPQVNLEGAFTHFLNIPVQVVDAGFINPNAPAGSTVSFRAGTEFSSSGSLKASQLIFNGSYLIALQVSKFYVELQQTYSQQTKEEVLFSVIQAYEMATVAKANLVFLDSMVQTTEKIVKEQQNYLELGMITQEVIDQLNYSVLTTKNAQLNADLQYKNSLTMLKLAMNYPIEQEIVVTENVNELMGKTASIATKNDVKQNITYSLLEKQVMVTEYTLKNDKAANLPSLNGFFQHTYNAYRNEFNFLDSDKKWFPQTFYGLSLSIPVFSGLQRYNKIEQAKVNVLKAENDLSNYEQTLKAQEIQFKNNLYSAQQRMVLQEANLKLATTIYQNATIKREIGSATAVEVTQKYNQLMMAQTEYVSASIDVLLAQLNIDKLFNNILPNN